MHYSWCKSRTVPRGLSYVLAFLLVTIPLCPCEATPGPPGPPETWDGPRNGAVGAEGWPSDKDARAVVTVVPPSPWVAGSWIECRLIIRPDEVQIAPGGGVRVALRRGSNASQLQVSNPPGEGYVTATAYGPSQLSEQALEELAAAGYISGSTLSASGPMLRTELEALDPQGASPWPRAVEVLLPDGLPVGGGLLVVLGDQSRGGPGFRVQTSAEETPALRAYTDGDADGVFGPILGPLHVRVIGGEAKKFHLAAPALVRAGRSFNIAVRAEDRYWNTALDYAESLDLLLVQLAGPEFWEDEPEPGIHPVAGEGGAVKDRVKVGADDWTEGRAEVKGLSVNNPGLYELRAHGGLTTVSLPLLVVRESPSLSLYWGDIHGHTELSDGAESAEGYLAFARNTSGLDFAAATDHDWLLSDSEWEVSVQAAEQVYEPGRFVTFPAYEWSGQRGKGGHHNVYYVSGEPEIFRCSRAASPSAPTGRELFQALRGRDVLLIPHVGGTTGEWDLVAQKIKTVCEITSVWGQNEQYGLVGIELGRPVGFIGSSDTHVGHPGRSHAAPPTFQVEPGGLAGVWAPELTREGIGEAIRSRCVYSTTGERIFIDLQVNGAPMGSEVEREEQVEIIARVAGTAPIETIEVRRWWQTALKEKPGSVACTLRWTDKNPRGREVFYYLRVHQADGNVAWTSPVWAQPAVKLYRGTRTREQE